MMTADFLLQADRINVRPNQRCVPKIIKKIEARAGRKCSREGWLTCCATEAYTVLVAKAVTVRAVVTVTVVDAPDFRIVGATMLVYPRTEQ